MLTSEELMSLESLLSRARLSAGNDRAANAEIITPGDVVQLRPGTCPHWQTSLLLVSKVRDNGGITGTILRPHRSGCSAAWYTYRPPEVARIGRVPFPEPGPDIKKWDYCAPCPLAEVKPIHQETRGRKRKPASSAEIQSAIEELPKDEQEALTVWMWARQNPIEDASLAEASRRNTSSPEDDDPDDPIELTDELNSEPVEQNPVQRLAEADGPMGLTDELVEQIAPGAQPMPVRSGELDQAIAALHERSSGAGKTRFRLNDEPVERKPVQRAMRDRKKKAVMAPQPVPGPAPHRSTRDMRSHQAMQEAMKILFPVKPPQQEAVEAKPIQRETQTPHEKNLYQWLGLREHTE